jgi:biotin operon repressor
MAKSIIDTGKALYLAEVLKVCGRGKREAIKGHELEEMVGILQIRQYINYLRKEGYPIGSCNSGYYYITSEAEFIETHCGIMRRIQSMEDAMDGVKMGWLRLQAN